MLVESGHARAVIDILDTIMGQMPAMTNRRSDAFQALRKGLGYCWSVAVVALPGEGKAAIEKWFAAEDPDIRWIMRENLKKARMSRMDSDWVEKSKKGFD